MKRAASADERIGATFSALADPTRRAVVRALMRAPQRAGELAQQVGTSAPALSRHLRVLKRAGLLTESSLDEDARVRLYQLAPNALAPLRSWLDEAQALWQEQLSSFAAFAEREGRAAPAVAKQPSPAPTRRAAPRSARKPARKAPSR